MKLLGNKKKITSEDLARLEEIYCAKMGLEWDEKVSKKSSKKEIS